MKRRAYVAASLAALGLTVAAWAGATPETVREANDPTWSETVSDEAAWTACVEAVWASGETTDAEFQACDAKYGDTWVYQGGNQ